MEVQRRTSGLGFFGTIGLVMAGLKLKERWDEYRQVPTDEEGRVALTETGDDAGRSSEERERLLLDTEVPTPTRRARRKKSCCVCCGVDCGLFWKAFGIVVGLAILYNVIQFIVWVVTPSPTGLENMPAYSSSLGCLGAPHTFNGSSVSYQVHTDKDFRHKVDIRGSGVGTFVIKPSTSDDAEVRYEMTLRSTDESLLGQVAVKITETDDKSTIVFMTPTPDINAVGDCSRFDIVVYVPQVLKELAITSHSTTHVLFDADEANINMDTLGVTLYAPDTNNQVLPHVGIHAKTMHLEVFRGWIVGDVSVVESASIKTQQGDGNVNIQAKILPYKSMDAELPTAEIRTVTGSGRTDVFVSSDKSFPHRKIDASHISSKNGDVYLTYRDAEFAGRVSLDSKSYSAKGLHPFPASGDSESDGVKWTHSAGDKDSGDTLRVTSRGWTGLYFY